MKLWLRHKLIGGPSVKVTVQLGLGVKPLGDTPAVECSLQRDYKFKALQTTGK